MPANGLFDLNDGRDGIFCFCNFLRFPFYFYADYCVGSSAFLLPTPSGATAFWSKLRPASLELLLLGSSSINELL